MKRKSLVPMLLLIGLVTAGCAESNGTNGAQSATASAKAKEADAQTMRNRTPGAIRVFQELQSITNIKQWDALGMPAASRAVAQHQLAECGGKGEIEIKQIRNFDMVAGAIGCQGDNTGQVAVFFRATDGKWKLFSSQTAPTCAQLRALGVPFPVPEGFIVNQCIENGELITPK